LIGVILAGGASSRFGGEPKGLNFVEFMTCIEGDACNFELFLKDTKAAVAQLEAMGHKERLAPLRKTAEAMRARVRVAFLLEVREFLQVAQHYLANELMMRLPTLLKKLSAKHDLPAKMAQAVEVLKAQMSKLPEPEVVFRQSMEAADHCETLMTRLHQKLQKNWPDHWTDEMQRRLENPTEEDHEKWLDEVEQELNALNQRYFSQQG
jgi:hypothetical protein